MKKTIMAVALLMGVSAVTTSFANNGMKIVEVVKLTKATDLNITALKGLKFKLSIENAENKTLISLINENDDVLFSEYAATNGDYTKVFDLSNLNDGKYTFEMRTGSERITKSLEIKTNVQRTVDFN